MRPTPIALPVVSAAQSAGPRQPPAVRDAAAVAANNQVAAASRCYRNRLPSRSVDRARLAQWETRECGRLDFAATNAVEADFRAAYKPKERPARITFDFSCSPVAAAVFEIQLENARKASGRFGFDRLMRRGNEFRVRRMFLPAPCVAAAPMVPTGVDCKLQLAEQTLEAGRVDALLGYVHAAVVGEIREIPLIGAVSVGSKDEPLEEYSAVTLADSTARIERSSLQEPLGAGRENQLPARLAMAKLLPVMGTPRYAEADLSDEDRLAFSIRTMIALLRRPPNWLSERYLSMAIGAGHIDMIPDLVQWVSSLPQAADYERIKWLAIAVIKQTTNYDLTREPDGNERGSSEILERYRRDCMVFEGPKE